MLRLKKVKNEEKEKMREKIEMSHEEEKNYKVIKKEKKKGKLLSRQRLIKQRAV